MEAVEEAVYKDFKRWQKGKGKSHKDVGDFMEEMYAMKVGKRNIFDKIKAMTLPPINRKMQSSSTLLEKLAICREDHNSTYQREKRAARRTLSRTESNILTLI